MASLGNVGVKAPQHSLSMKVAPLAVVDYKLVPAISYPVSGRLSGVVSIAGTPRVGVVVRLYYRSSGQLIEQAISGTGGTYSFAGLDVSDPGAYYVTFIDPNTSTPYNFTVTKDHLTAG